MGSYSLGLYSEWVRELEDDSQMSVGYRTEGTLVVALEQDDAYLLQHLYESQKLLDLHVEWISGADAREIEPLLSPKITAVISCTDDHQVDNRLMVKALIAAYKESRGMLIEHVPVEKIAVCRGKRRGFGSKEFCTKRCHRSFGGVLVEGN